MKLKYPIIFYISLFFNLFLLVIICSWLIITIDYDDYYYYTHAVSEYFSPSSTYATFFDNSIVKLEEGADVCYLGKNIGKVIATRISPDNKIITVVMKIRGRNNFNWIKGTVATVDISRNTGDLFIDLRPGKIGEEDKSPKLTFSTEYPVIPSIPPNLPKVIKAQPEQIMPRIALKAFGGVSLLYTSAAFSVGPTLSSQQFSPYCLE